MEKYIEIVGPAAAGKTTLALELKNRHPRFRLRYPPDWRRPRYWPFLFRNSFSMAPALASLTFGKRGRHLSRKEFFYMLFLSGWHRQLRRAGPDQGITILDQGPIYMLSLFIIFREGQMANPLFGKWWRKTVSRWGGVLGAIVRLDASDEVLAKRINTREQEHIIKGASLNRTHDFLDRSRVALDQAVALLRAGRSGPTVVCYDTGGRSPNELVHQLLEEFAQEDLAGRDRPA